MMSVSDLLQWWNLIYAVPLVVSLVWIAATVIAGAHGDGGHSHGAGHAVHDVAHGVENAIGHALHHGAGHDVGHGHADDAGHAGDASHSHGQSHDDTRTISATGLLFLVLGIGQVPVTLLIGIFMLCWGAFGLFANQLLSAGVKYPALYIWPSVGITLGVSLVLTRCLSAVVGRLIPPTETFGVTRLELVGSIGKTVFATTQTAGTVDIKDTYGTVHRVQAKAEDGAEPIPTGTEVMVLDFDEDDKRYVVRVSTL